MITIKRPVGYLLCGALLMALPVARAEEEATEWKAKCRELEEKVQVLEEELDESRPPTAVGKNEWVTGVDEASRVRVSE